MRNGGDRGPSGASGRRHRASGPDSPARTGGNGGASLFTPAYRASHAGAGTYPGEAGRIGADPDRADAPFLAAAGSGRNAPDQPGPGSDWADSDQPAGPAWAEQDELGGGYGWAEADQPGTGYDQAADQPGAGYSWAADDLTSAGHSWSRTDMYDSPAVPPPVSNAVRGFPPSPGEPLPVYPPGPFAAWNRGAAAGDSGMIGAEVRAPGSESSRQFTAATITPAEFDTDYSLPAIRDPAPGEVGRARTDVGSRRQRPPSAPAAHGRSSGSHSSRARQAGPGRSRARARRWSVRLAIGAAIVMIAAVTLILVNSLGRATPASHPSAGGQNKNTPGSSASGAPSPTPPPGKWSYIGTRATDPVPLTGPELFPVSFASAGVFYGRSVTTGGKNCRAALIGAALQAAVRSGSCAQEVRATYLSRTTKMMATIGVFNLKSFAAASKAALAAGQAEFVAQLPAKSGPTHHIGSGTGIEEALVKGHYLILVWAQFLKLHAPKTTTQRLQLVAFMNLLIRDTANTSLSYRMVDGKPIPPG